MKRSILASGLLALVVLGCHGKKELTPPPPPLRPDPEVSKISPSGRDKDCEPTDPAHELKALTFDQRSIPEGMRLAEEGTDDLRYAQSPEVDRLTREDYVTKAVKAFITSLEADPYNVKATYGLAGAYAQIHRNQCSINLLTRLLQMRQHASKHAEVEAALDHLLGRKQALDQSFADMRTDERFRSLIMKMCDGTNDPNCVYGGQKDGRER